MRCILLSICVITGIVCCTGGCGPDGSPTPQPSSQTVDYFPHAAAAGEQFDSDVMPRVVDVDGDLITLAVDDSQAAGWDTAEIVATENADGSIGYKLLLGSVPVDDSRVAVVARDLGLLAAVERAEVSLERRVKLGGTNSSDTKTAPAKTITILDESYDDTVDLVDLTGTTIYTDPGGALTVQIAEGYVHFYPDLNIELKIDGPGSGVFDLITGILDDIRGIVNGVADELRQLGDIDGAVDSFEELIEMSRALDDTAELGSSLEALAEALVDPSRIELARIRIAGTLAGKFTLQATTTSEWTADESVDLSDVVAVLPIRVPVSSPLPVFLILNVVINLDMRLDGRLDVTTGFEFETSVDATFALEDGDLTVPTDGVFSSPEFAQIGPEIDAQLGFSARIGIIPQVGVSLAEILEVTIEPELYLECDAALRGTLTSEEMCVSLDWDLYAGLDGDVVARVDLLDVEEGANVYSSPHVTLATGTWEAESCLEPPDDGNAGDDYEPDDDATQATSISSGQSQTHSIVPVGDEDWLALTLSSPSDVVIETSGLSGDTRLWLYDSGLTEIAFNDDGGEGTFSYIEHTALPSGTYYIKVDEYNNNDEIESYDVSLTATPTEDENAGDAYEPDDEWTEATPISDEQVQTHSIFPVGDVDWVQFTLDTASDVVIETSGQSGDTRLWLYDSDLTEISSNDDGGDGMFSLIEQAELPGGTYYVKVTEYNNNDEIESYTISLSVTVIEDSGSGVVSGLVIDAVGRDPLSDVTVSAYHNGALVEQSTTGSPGTFSIQVPAADGYQVTVSKTDYLSETYYDIDVTVDQEVYLEPILQIASEYAGTGDFGGQVINAFDGTGVSGMSINFRRGVNATTGSIVATATSGSQGEYSVSDLEAGSYTGEINGSGFLTSYFTAVCMGGMTNAGQDGEVTPLLDQGETRIVLTWGETPSDLDSHLTGPTSEESRFHVYYGSRTYAYDGVTYADLDLDDTSSYGPETITIYDQVDGLYRYSVHDFSSRLSSSSTSLSNSGSQVKVYRAAGLVATFNVPADQEGTLWTVFELDGDQITPVNDMSYEDDTGAILKATADTDARLIRELQPKD